MVAVVVAVVVAAVAAAVVGDATVADGELVTVGVLRTELAVVVGVEVTEAP